MADKFGSYDGAFYMAGGAIILGAAIPFFLLCTKRRKAGQRQEIKTDNETDIVFSNENITANLDAGEVISEAPSDTKMYCTTRNGSSLKENCKDEKIGSEPNDTQLPFYGFVNKSFTWSDEAISNDTEMAQADPQAEINSSIVPSVVTEDDRETMEQLQYNTE